MGRGIVVAWLMALACRSQRATVQDGGAADASAAADAAVAAADVPADLLAPTLAGPLCGPPDRPCVVVRRETLLDGQVRRNDAPSIALRPADQVPFVLFSLPGGGFAGRLAQRLDSGAWQVTPTDAGLASGALVFDEEGRGWAVLYEGSDAGPRLWEWNGSWQARQPVPLWVPSGAHGFARDRRGGLHVAGIMHSAVTTTVGGLPETVAGYAHGAGDLTASSVSELPSSVVGPALALSAAGKAYLGFCALSGTRMSVFAVAPPAAAEEVAGCESAGPGLYVVRLAITEAGGVEAPHLFFGRGFEGTRRELVHATRTAGGWEVTSLVRDEEVVPGCSTRPTVEGEVCDFDRVEHWPLSALAGDRGEVRFLYSRIRSFGRQVAHCGGFNGCTRELISFQFESRLELAWVDGAATGRAALAADFAAVSATMVRDTQGRIHVAAYDAAGFEKDYASVVRYLLLAPAGQ